MSEPVFTAPRRGRGKGPGRRAILGSVAALALISASVGAWLQWGQGDAPVTPEVAAVPDSAPAEAAAPVDTTPPPPPPVRLTVSVEPASATVTVDEASAADTGLVLPVGSYPVHAEAAGYLPLDTVVDLTADLTLALALTRVPPTTGTLAVSANLPGRVLLDGGDRGAAPLSGLRLRPGTYTVRFVPEGADGLAEDRRVTVRAGAAARAAFEITDALVSVGVRSPRWATVYNGEVKLGDTPLIQQRLPARVYTLRVAREGFVEQERLVRLEPGQVFQWVDIELEPAGE
jgi:hypothetical protein